MTGSCGRSMTHRTMTGSLWVSKGACIMQDTRARVPSCKGRLPSRYDVLGIFATCKAAKMCSLFSCVGLVGRSIACAKNSLFGSLRLQHSLQMLQASHLFPGKAAPVSLQRLPMGVATALRDRRLAPRMNSVLRLPHLLGGKCSRHPARVAPLPKTSKSP